MRRGGVNEGRYTGTGLSEPSNNESPNLHSVFLRERRNDTVQAQVLD